MVKIDHLCFQCMGRDKIDEAKSRGWEKEKRKTKVKDLKKNKRREERGRERESMCVTR